MGQIKTKRIEDGGQYQEVSTGYKPRPLQAAMHLALRSGGVNQDERVRFSCLAIHRRFGKSVFAINELIDAAMTCDKLNPRVFYMAATYRQCKSIAWDYVKEFTRNIPDMQYSETELTAVFPKVEIEINGVKKISQAKLILLGSDQYDSHRGIYCDALVIDEWGNQHPAAWKEVFRPALADRLGWVIFLGTPNGKNHFYTTYQNAVAKPKEWFAATYRADETGLIPDAELEMMRDEMGEDEYRQEMLCDWAAAIRGSYYGSDMSRAKVEGRITRVPHESKLQTIACFDLGIDDYTAVWIVQFFQQEIRLIGFEEYKDTGLLDVINELERNYRYLHFSQLWMPHDIGVRELTTGHTRLETLEELGYRVDVAPKLRIDDGISAVRSILSKCWFDQVACMRGIDCLENYRKAMDTRTGTFLNKPSHDEFSHGADSFRYLATLYHQSLGDPSRSVSGRRDLVARKPKVIRAVT